MDFFSAKPSSNSSPTNETGNEPNSDEPPPETGEEHLPAPPPEPPKEDGVLLYLAIKVKDEFKDEDEVDNNMRKLFRNDYNNNPGTIQKKVKHSVFKTITNEKGKKNIFLIGSKLKDMIKFLCRFLLSRVFF